MIVPFNGNESPLSTFDRETCSAFVVCHWNVISCPGVTLLSSTVNCVIVGGSLLTVPDSPSCRTVATKLDSVT